MTKNLGRGRYVAHVAQQSRTEPYPAEVVLVAISGEAACVRRGVEAPGLLADRAFGDVFKVLGVDDRVEGRLLVELQFGGS